MAIGSSLGAAARPIGEGSAPPAPPDGGASGLPSWRVRGATAWTVAALAQEIPDACEARELPPPRPAWTYRIKPARIFETVSLSMWAWRQRVAREMRNFALTELPRGKVRRDWKNKAGAFAECGRTVAALACQGCG